MEILHRPVLAQEVLKAFGVPPTPCLMIDCTVGEGGHTSLFLDTYPQLSVIGVDRDPTILAKATERLQHYGARFTPVNSWFDEYLASYKGPNPFFILFDLGISMYHYEGSERGFSFHKDERLDMRLDPTATLSAFEIVNTYSAEELSNVLYQYGEERYSRRISRTIVEKRSKNPIETTKELADCIYTAVPPSYRHTRLHPATRSFQALRIEVNSELSRIQPAVKKAIELLAVEGRVGVISFHSLEDRLVKQLFKEEAKGCVCPAEAPLCTCSKEATIAILTKKPIVATDQENAENPPSRSAKLRVAQKRGNVDEL
ncbi:MAG: 16S rRNA (cytosine(1402)-N(4))-methyltransferase RsmH [Sphaerochaetaceae bacterium]